MKKFFRLTKSVLLGVCFLVGTTASAQVNTATTTSTTAVGTVAKYGYLHVDTLLQNLPEYKEQTTKLGELRKQYEAETERNEAEFKRQFAEYLSGQSTFPATILMKRQRDLQEAMEKNLAFRRESESLLEKAEADMRQPLRQRLQRAINAVAQRLKLDYVVNLDNNAIPYLNPQLSVDVTELVKKEVTTHHP